MANKNHWYRKCWHDYAADTRHLTMLEHGAYNLLLDYYYSQKGEVVANDNQLLRVCSSKTPEEDIAVKFILNNFFTKINGKYTHSRADLEMKLSRKVSRIRAKVGSKGGSKSQANRRAKNNTVTVTPTVTLKPKRNTKENVKTEQYIETLNVFLPDWLPPQLFKDFMKHRMALKKPLTTKAAELLISKLTKFKKDGYNPVECLNTAIENGWVSIWPPKDNSEIDSNGSKSRWFDTDDATECKAKELGITRQQGENLGAFRTRIQNEINRTRLI